MLFSVEYGLKRKMKPDITGVMLFQKPVLNQNNGQGSSVCSQAWQTSGLTSI